MRKAYVFVIFSIILFLSVRCAKEDSPLVEQTTTINNLICNQAKIGNVEITQEQEGVHIWNIKDTAEIQRFLETIAEIPLDKLSPEQDIAFMNKGLKFVEKGMYRVDFYAEGQVHAGHFLIWPDGKIYVRDTKPLDGQKQISYLSKEAHLKIYQGIVDRTKEMAAKGQEYERISARYWLGEAGEKTIEYNTKTVGEKSRDLLNEKGDTILSGFEEYDLMLKLIFAKKDGQWGLYNSDGESISTSSYEEIANYEMPDGNKANGLVGVRKNGLWGALDQEGKVVIRPEFEYIDLNYYEEVEPFIKVKKNGRFGYLTREGQPLVDTVWDNAFMDVLNVREDIIFVRQGDKWGGIKIKGGKALPVDWGLVPSEEARLSFNNWKYDYQHDFYRHQIQDGQTSISTTARIFFNDYFRNNSRRIRSLPEFSQEKDPDWAELTKFVYENTEYDPDDHSITREAFAETVKRYFGGITHTDKASTYLAYIDEKYIPKGWSDHGFYIYELTDLARGKTTEGKDSWKARITGYYFYELDGDPDETFPRSKNAQTVWSKMKEEAEYKGLNFWQACDRLAWNNPGDVLEPAGEWVLEFIVNDPLGDIYFTYLSCEKKGFQD